MRAAITPLPNTPPWLGAQLQNNGENFTFTFTNDTEKIREV